MQQLQILKYEIKNSPVPYQQGNTSALPRDQATQNPHFGSQQFTEMQERMKMLEA